MRTRVKKGTIIIEIANQKHSLIKPEYTLMVAIALKLCRVGVGVETSPTLDAQPAFVDILLEEVGTRLMLLIAT